MTFVEGRPSRDVTPPSAPERRPEVLLALIEHGSRPLAYVILGVLFVVALYEIRDPVGGLLKNASQLRIGNFEVAIHENAASQQVGGELQALAGLTQDQLHLFLVLGRDRPGQHITYDGPEASLTNLEALKTAGILSSVTQEPNKRLSWTVSDKGTRLHAVIFEQLLLSIRRAPPAKAGG